MLKFVLFKSFRALVTIWLAVTLTFFALRMAGDPTVILLPDNVSDDIIALYRERWGFDKPLLLQYVNYVKNIFSGDLGIVLSNGRNAVDVVFERLPATLLLAAASLAIAISFGVPAGMLAAVFHKRKTDYVVSGMLAVGNATPNFFIGILLILIFSVQLRLVPSSGYGTAAHLILPAVTLGTWTATSIARVTRTSMLEVLGQPYIITAKAKGFPRLYQLIRHALPNAAIPIITVTGLNTAQLLAGAAITETVFAWPGIGRLVITAASAREVAVVQVVLLVTATLIVSVNLLTDIIAFSLNPLLKKRG